MVGLIEARFGNSERNGSTSQNIPDFSGSRTAAMPWFRVLMSASDPEARAALIFSSLDASGTHWNSKSTPLCSFRAVMIGPEASGVVGVCSIDIQVSVPPSPAEPPPPPELPQEARAPAPAMPAAARGRDFRRVLRWIMRGPFVVEKQGGAGVQVGVGAGVGVREWTRRRR